MTKNTTDEDYFPIKNQNVSKIYKNWDKTLCTFTDMMSLTGNSKLCNFITL